MRRLNLGVISALAFAALLSSAATAGPPRSFTGGLQGTITIQRAAKGGSATATLSLKNAGTSPVHLLLFDYPKLEGAGSVGFWAQGVTAPMEMCSKPRFIEKCMATTDTRKSGAPLQSYTVLDPGIEIDLPFTFAFNPPSTAPMYTFSATFIYRIVSDPKADQTLTDKEKLGQLMTTKVSFPNVSVAQAE